MLVFVLIEQIAKLSVDLGLSIVTAALGHVVGELLPYIFVDAVDIELHGGVADEAVQHGVQVSAPVLGGLLGACDAN